MASMGPALASILDLLLRTLDPAEREIVEGDLRELCLPSSCAVRDVLGLVVRRQIAFCLDWRAWLTLLVAALALGLALNRVSQYWSDATAISAWLYVDNWTPG